MDCLNEINPFKHTLNLTKWDYVTSVILGIFLIPIRVILIAVVVLVAWIGAVIYTHDLFKNPEWMPNSKLRLKTYEVLLKLLSWSFGFVVTLSGTRLKSYFQQSGPSGNSNNTSHSMGGRGVCDSITK